MAFDAENQPLGPFNFLGLVGNKGICSRRFIFGLDSFIPYKFRVWGLVGNTGSDYIGFI